MNVWRNHLILEFEFGNYYYSFEFFFFLSRDSKESYVNEMVYRFFVRSLYWFLFLVLHRFHELKENMMRCDGKVLCFVTKVTKNFINGDNEGLEIDN